MLTSYNVLLACTFNGVVLTPLATIHSFFIFIRTFTVDKQDRDLMRSGGTTVDVGQHAYTNYPMNQDFMGTTLYGDTTSCSGFFLLVVAATIISMSMSSGCIPAGRLQSM